MSSLLEPNYTLLSFLFVQKFVYPEFLFLLAILRGLLARGTARLAALLAALLAAGIVLTVFAPALNLQTRDWYTASAPLLNHGQGMTALLSLSAVLASSGALPGHRHRWIDLLHGLACLGLLGFWLATMI